MNKKKPRRSHRYWTDDEIKCLEREYGFKEKKANSKGTH